ncbi:hypothetical protein HIM_04813 [Hirsutella minnesotensis 3608]|uniref:Amino-acid acetyltransferase, mitochondrial n=1 Tax=Hirsutella minnesotensis 3608 TaxID=1043627 RepID=A0A0F7ZKV1_9HYPO|nr:hypothetical protein HIM_04813 [Hirsutella minnesotensis 3608]
MTWTHRGSRSSSCAVHGLTARGRNTLPLYSWHTSSPTHGPIASPTAAVRYSSNSAFVPRARKPAVDRDVIVSVLESSATRRDANGYLQKYTSKKPLPLPKPDVARFLQGTQPDQEVHGCHVQFNVAIVKLRVPQQLTTAVVYGIAKTLCQLRMLGLLAVVIVDCGIGESRQTFEDESLRLCEAVDSVLGQSTAKLANNIFAGQPSRCPTTLPSMFSDKMRVDDQELLRKALQHDMVVIAPSLARRDDLSVPQPAEPHETVLALTKYLNGMQFPTPTAGDEPSVEAQPKKIASVERLILLDPVGGTPMPSRPDLCHRFINLEQEYSSLISQLATLEVPKSDAAVDIEALRTVHVANLRLANDVVRLLPPSSSVLITTPLAAANMRPQIPSASLCPPSLGFAEMVTTRTQRNPLLHNLLTDRPASSPSLPLQRVQGESVGYFQMIDSGAATLVKRGMPVTIYPDPHLHPWSPPKPGSSRLRLTDTCIDLPRLIHLIEDSFSRKLDVEAYLDRVKDNLAGIIIAGEYEGGAILTWERPLNVPEQDAYQQGRLVPYLDKFAVLKKRQGSGGVADIVFNAMVQDCFPRGVCWRSRKNNPVNKWYFERSTGTCKLSESGWTMFWTTQGLGSKHPILGDYEAVCRGVQPTWADKKHILE